MIDRTIALVAFAVLLAFLGILLWSVPRLDLGVVIAITVVLGGYDFLRRRNKGGNA